MRGNFSHFALVHGVVTVRACTRRGAEYLHNIGRVGVECLIVGGGRCMQNFGCGSGSRVWDFFDARGADFMRKNGPRIVVEILGDRDVEEIGGCYYGGVRLRR